MSQIVRWDPFEEMVDIQRAMDQLMRRTMQGQDGQQSLSFTMDVSETPDAYQIEASLPGVKPEDIDVTVDQNVLTIRGELKAEEKKDKKTYHMRERRYGMFARSIALPTPVNADDIEAHFENGVLKLRLPKMEEAKPKRVQIQNGSSSNKEQDLKQGERRQAESRVANK